MRDRVAVIFMTASVIAALVLGGAVVHDLNRPTSSQVIGVQSPESSSGSLSGVSGNVGAQNATQTGGQAATAGTPGSAGHLVTTGSNSTGNTTGGSQGAQLSTQSVGVSNGTVTVGGIYDETGPFDATVERDTVRSAFDLVNATGGVNGYKFQLAECDSGYDPTIAHQCSQRLVSQNALAIVGWLSVAGEQAETTWFNNQGVPIIGGLGVPSEFSSQLSYPVTDNFVTVGTAMGDHAKDLGIHHPGVILLNVNFIAPAQQALVNALSADGIHPTAVDDVDPTKPDYTDEAIKMRTNGSDSLIVLLDPFSYARLFQALDREDFHPKFFGYGLDKKSAQAQYGSAVYGSASLTPVLEPDQHMGVPAMATYYGAVQKYFPNQVPALDVYAEQDWVATQVFLEAVRRLGSTPLNRKTLVDSLNSLKNYNTGSFTVPISYSAGNAHDPNRCFQWTHNNQGTWNTDSGWTCF